MLFNSYFIPVVPSFDLNTFGTLAREYIFPPHSFCILYFLYFVAQIARIPSLFLKTNPFNAKTLSYAYLWVKEIAEKLEKSECWMVKWSSRNESFEDLETKGKTKSGMNKAVKIVLKG